MSFNCPTGGRNGSGHLQVGICLSQQSSHEHELNKWWILLDTCSTHSCMSNRDLMLNISACARDDVLRLNTNLWDVQTESAFQQVRKRQIAF